MIYPKTAAFFESEEISFVSDDGISVFVLFVDCHCIESSLSEMIKVYEM